MLFHLHKTFYTTYQIKHTNVSEKGNFIHKVPENKQLNNWWSCFISVQCHALSFALDWQIHVNTHMFVSTHMLFN